MALVQTTYFHIECNGPAATPFRPHCGAEADGGWEQEEVEARAVEKGWGKEGRSWFCPPHYAAVSSAPVRTPRKNAAAE